MSSLALIFYDKPPSNPMINTVSSVLYKQTIIIHIQWSRWLARGGGQ